MKFMALLLLLSMFLPGCATSPMQTSWMSREELTTVSEEQLISGLANEEYRNNLMFQEAMRRGLMTPEEVRLIKAGRLEIAIDYFSKDFKYNLIKPL